MSAPCPPQEQLERLLDDRLETVEDAALARHVETCAACQARLERLLTGSLSTPSPAQATPEMADTLLIRLKKRGRRGDEAVQHPGTQPLAKGPGQGAGPGPEVPGYEVLSEIGRGGMGVIYKARHLRLGRVVALKMILAGAHARSDELRRFHIEASAVARLAHPGIVGVYDVGEHEGLPYLSLELVEGGSLKQLLAGTPQPPRASARLVEQLARAVQHAHEAGIVHRDLKPANVLLKKTFTAENAENAEEEKQKGGNKREESKRSPLPSSLSVSSSASSASSAVNTLPKITDFGLAKLVAESPADGPTQSGAVVGTPGYMAPEQAAGNQRQVGPAADVYALGAILYECLTGRPPFQAATILETLLQVMHDEPVSIGSLQPRVPRDLATIAMRCLEKQTVKRYASARDLADDLARFLAGQPIHARRVGPFERGWRWCKRNPVVAGLTSGLIVALVMGIAGVSWKWWEADQRRQQADASAVAEKLARQDEAAQRAKAEKASDRTRQVLDAMVSGVTGDSLSTQKAISDEQKKFLSGVLSYYQEFAGEKADDEKTRARTANAGYRVGLIEARLGRKEEGVTALRMARDGYGKLATDFPAVPDYRRYLAISHHNLGLLLANLGKRAEAQEQYQSALAIQEKLAADFPAVPDYRRYLAVSHNNLGLLLANLGKRAEAQEQYQKGLAIREKLGADFPAVPEYRQDLAISHHNLGLLLEGLGKRAEAEERYQKGLAIQQKLAADSPAAPEYRQDLAGSHTNLGALLAGLGKRAEAQEQYQKALAIREKLAADFPAVPDYRRYLAISHHNLGLLLADLGQGAEAEEQYQKGLAIQEKLAADFPAVLEYRQELAWSHNNLGRLLAGLGKRAEAQEQYQSALAIREKLATDFPAVPDYRRELARSHHSLGVLLADLGKRVEAEERYQKGLAIQEKLAADFRAVPDDRRELALSHTNLAVLLAGLGKRAEAQEQYQKGLAIQEKLAADFSTVPDYRQELAVSHTNLGNLLAGLGKRAEAQEQYQRALAIQEKLAADFPTLPDYRRYLAVSHNSLGALLAGLGKRAEAQEQVKKALAIREKLAADFPAVPDYRHDLASSHNNLGVLLADLGKRAEAQEQYQKALVNFEKLAADFPAVPEYRRDLARSHNSLGILLAGLGKRAEAEQQYQKGLAIYEKLVADFPAVPAYQVNLGGSYCNLGNLMGVGGKLADSLAWFQKAIATLRPVHEQDPRAVTARQFLRNSHRGRALVHRRLGKYDDALQEWDRVVELSDQAEQPGIRAARVTFKLQAGQVAAAVAEVAELTKSPRWNAGQWYDFACVYAVASGKVVDQKQPYADRAMALLHQAVKAGYKDAVHMTVDTDLDALRGRDDFKKLLTELAKPAAPKK